MNYAATKSFNFAAGVIDRQTIRNRFCGPPESGNGGYICGMMAAYMDGPVTVTLRRPPPLDTPLDIVSTAEGGIELHDDGGMLVECRSGYLDFEVPEPPSLADATLASMLYDGYRQHSYPGCFVCGPDRGRGDGLRVFAGPCLDCEDSKIVSAPWIPDDTLCAADGRIASQFLWAALDCPGYFAMGTNPEPALLGRMSGEIIDRPRPGDICIVIGWPIGRDGRKMFAGTAIFDAAGKLLGRAKATWITI